MNKIKTAGLVFLGAMAGFLVIFLLGCFILPGKDGLTIADMASKLVKMIF